jgi:hypothetical protein
LAQERCNHNPSGLATALAKVLEVARKSKLWAQELVLAREKVQEWAGDAALVKARPEA